MNKSELLNRLTDIEWEDFEVKNASDELPKNIWETVSSFSNTSGGWIVLGISQKGKKFEISGLTNPEKIEQDFTTVLRSQNKFNVLITPKCRKYDINGLTVLAFYLPASAQKPVFFNTLTNTFIRTASGDQRASESEINAMLRDQLFGVMSAKPVEKTSINDLNQTTLRRYRDYMSRFNPSLSYNTLSDNEFLEKMQITEGDHLTYGGLLFMGKNLSINKTFPDFRVDFLEIPGTSYADAETRYTFRLEEQENLWEYYFAIIDRLKRKIDMPFKMNELGIAIEDSPQFDAIREALVNMLMHSDFFSPIKPRVRVFLDRIEFENPGAFPRPIQTLLKKDISIPRNPVLAKLFRSAKLADNAGYGFDKMLKWEKSTNTKVYFENSIDVALVAFSFSDFIEKQAEKQPENSQKTSRKTAGKQAENKQKNNSQYLDNKQDADIIQEENKQKNSRKTSRKTAGKQPKNKQKNDSQHADNKQDTDNIQEENKQKKVSKKTTNKTSRKATKKQPKNKQKNNSQLPGIKQDTNSTQEENKQKKVRKKTTNKTSKKQAENKQKIKNTILGIIQSNPIISRKKISTEIGLSPGGVDYHLSILKKEGRIKRIGGAKGGSWIIIEP